MKWLLEAIGKGFECVWVMFSLIPSMLILMLQSFAKRPKKQKNMICKVKNQWQLFRDYINSHPIGDNISRQNVLKHVYQDRKNWVGYSRQTTIDTYRLALDRLGILALVARGLYKIEYHIRTDISFEKIKRLAYPKRDWQEWFIVPEKRRESIIQKQNALSFNYLLKENQNVNI